MIMNDDSKYWLSAVIALVLVSYGTSLLLAIPGFIEQGDTFKTWLHAIVGSIFIVAAIVVGFMNSLFKARSSESRSVNEDLIMKAFDTASKPNIVKTQHLTVDNSQFLDSFQSGSRMQVLFFSDSPVMNGDKVLFHLQEDYGQLYTALIDTVVSPTTANDPSLPVLDMRSVSTGTIASNVIVLVQ